MDAHPLPAAGGHWPLAAAGGRLPLVSHSWGRTPTANGLPEAGGVRHPSPCERASFGVLSVASAAAAAAEVRGRRLSRFAGDGAAGGPSGVAARPTWRTRFRAWWNKYGKFDRKKLSEMGIVCFLSYGLLSNVIAITLILISTYSAMVTTGASPLSSRVALRQFGITYGGLYVISSLTRPLRMALAVGLTPLLERLVGRLQRSASCTKGVAVMLTVTVANVVTLGALFAGMLVASSLTGVPVDVWHIGALFKAGKEARSIDVA
uniref:Uncharacterized protein n=1 Tax=Alexandrium monilatum TaxID=311494 RepID=A0A7S4PY95_9DINO